MDSVDNVIELIGTSDESWEQAPTAAVQEASKTLTHLRAAEVIEQDLVIEASEIVLFRSKVPRSFKQGSAD